MHTSMNSNTIESNPLPKEFLFKNYTNNNKHSPQIKCSKISNNSFSFSTLKLRSKRAYVSQTQLNPAKSRHNSLTLNNTNNNHRPPLAYKAKDQFIPGANEQLSSTAKNMKIFPRATYNFLSNIQRFEYPNTASQNAKIGPGTYDTEGIKNKQSGNANITYYYHRKVIDHRNMKKKANESLANEDKQAQFDRRISSGNKETSDMINDNLIIISNKGLNKRANSESNIKQRETPKMGRFLRRVNREVFEVLPSRKIVAVFVSKSQKGIPSINKHIPGPTYYNPKKLIHKSYYSNTKKMWL